MVLSRISQHSRKCYVVNRYMSFPIPLLPSQLYSRYYTILSSGIFKPKQYTKYRVTTDFSLNSDFEDLYLAEPSREDLVTFKKDEPFFLRFLKLVTDQESRPEAFKAFARRCEAGLIVEKDVFITKSELLETLWENGYSELELNAYEIAFPANYKFHYPELAVLFELKEEDCYKYCLRKRAGKCDELIEIKHRPTASKIASYGLLTTALWFGFQNNVFGNIWMMVKTWPFFAVFYMLGSHFQKALMAKIHRESIDESQTTLENRLDGEDHVYLQMKKYANDSLCLDYLESFKPSVREQFKDYHRAALIQLREQMVEGMTKHLLAVQQAEKAIESSLQDIIIRETITAFREAFKSNESLRGATFDAAVEALSHSEETEVKDPVGRFFKDSLNELIKPTKTANSSVRAVVDRVNEVFHQQEKEFLNQFTVTETEAEKVRSLRNSICNKVGLDETTGIPNLHRLSAEQLKTIEKLYKEITSKVGLGSLPLPFGASPKSLVSTDESCLAFLENINRSVHKNDRQFRDSQLQAFLKAFA